MARPDLLEIGRVVKPHGIRGEVIVDLITDRTERLAVGSRLVTERGELEVRHSRPHQHRWIVGFDGVADRDGAEALRGAVLLAPPLDDPGELWVHDLIASEVVDTGGAVLGVVVEVHANPASDLLVLDNGGLVPVVFVVGTEPGRVVVDPPAGLLD